MFEPLGPSFTIQAMGHWIESGVLLENFHTWAGSRSGGAVFRHMVETPVALFDPEGLGRERDVWLSDSHAQSESTPKGRPFTLPRPWGKVAEVVAVCHPRQSGEGCNGAAVFNRRLGDGG